MYPTSITDKFQGNKSLDSQIEGVTLWEIVNEPFHIHHLVTFLRQCGFVQGHCLESTDRLLPEVVQSLRQFLANAEEPLQRLGMNASYNMVMDFRMAIDRGNDFTAVEFGTRAFSCFKTLQCECEHVICVRVEDESPSKIDSLPNTIQDRFPGSLGELREAEECLKAHRPTACVFHLMRAIEYPLKATWKTLGVVKTAHYENWGQLFGPMDNQLKKPPVNPIQVWSENITYFSELVFDFRAAKRAYRDSTMHVESTYTLAEAESIFNASLSLIAKAAIHLDQDGNFIS